MIDEKTLDKIRKLLALAEHPSTGDGERDLANSRAAELIARYGIAEAMLTAADPRRDKVEWRTLDVSAPYALEKAEMLSWVSSVLGCTAILLGRGQSWADGYDGRRVRLYGFSSDLDRVEVLYTSLLVQAHRGLAAARPDTSWLYRHGKIPASVVAAYRRTWFRGFAGSVADRLRTQEKAARRQAEQEGTAGPSVALVLRDRRTRVEQVVTEQNPELREAPRRNLSGGGGTDGMLAGYLADLGGTRLGGAPAGIER